MVTTYTTLEVRLIPAKSLAELVLDLEADSARFDAVNASLDDAADQQRRDVSIDVINAELTRRFNAGEAWG